MPEADWAPESTLPPSFGPNAYSVDVCPGYLVRLPVVQECVQAYVALQAGALQVGFPRIAQEIWDGVMALRSAFETRKVERIREDRNNR
jgi:hypothetical protein